MTAVAIAPDGTWLATDQRRRDGADLGRGHRAARAPPSPATPARVTAVAIAPDGTWLATASSDDGRCGSGIPPPASSGATLTGHTGRVTAVAIAPDGTWLATASDDGTARIWDPATGQPRRHPHRPHRRGDARCAIAPDGTWLATASDDGTARIWDAATGTAPRHPHRPHRRGDRGGDRPGRHLARHRQRRRHGADLGRRHRPTRGDHPHRPHRRGDRAWRSPRTAPGSPPAATTARCGSGIPPPVSAAPPSPAHRAKRRDGRPDGNWCHYLAVVRPASVAIAPTAPGSPPPAPAIRTGRCVSGTPPLDSIAPPSPATPAW